MSLRSTGVLCRAIYPFWNVIKKNTTSRHSRSKRYKWGVFEKLEIFIECVLFHKMAILFDWLRVGNANFLCTLSVDVLA